MIYYWLYVYYGNHFLPRLVYEANALTYSLNNWMTTSMIAFSSIINKI